MVTAGSPMRETGRGDGVNVWEDKGLLLKTGGRADRGDFVSVW